MKMLVPILKRYLTSNNEISSEYSINTEKEQTRTNSLQSKMRYETPNHVL